MTPHARIASAASVIDEILAGLPAEQALTRWARRSRFAGSKDRAAIRDHVFDALRRRRSWGWLGGGESGRALMLGMVRDTGIDPQSVFKDEPHALGALTEAERNISTSLADAPGSTKADVQDWIFDRLQGRYGDRASDLCEALRHRAPVHLRANTLKTSRAAVMEMLKCAGYAVEAGPLAETSIAVTGHARGLTATDAFADGQFEMQDAASQHVCEYLSPFIQNARILDYCAGGGGKSLALAALGAGEICAHDANFSRMKDLPNRAARAGASIDLVHNPTGKFDLVLCDAPCSGSGAWRRQPAAKWSLTPAHLADLCGLQTKILNEGSRFVRPGGHLAYSTCSLLEEENGNRVSEFLSKNLGWSEGERVQLTPLDGGDGFFLSILKSP